jgi:DNA polymerase III delta subunit
MRQLRDAFREKFDPRGHAIQMLDGAQSTAEQIVSALGSGGLFSTKRFVGIDDLTPTSPCFSSTALLDAFRSVGEDSDRIVVLRFVPAASAKKGRPAKSTMPKIVGAKSEEFPLLAESGIRSWITTELKARKGTITREAQELLLLRTKGDLWRLDQELEKLLAAGNGAITIDLVQALVAGDVRSDIFAVTDALGQRQRARALHLVSQELQSGSHPLVVVAALERHIQTLFRVREILDRGASPKPEALDLHPFVVKKAMAQARSLSRDVLHQWHHAVLEIEKDLKTSPLDAETLIDRCLMRVQP